PAVLWRRTWPGRTFVHTEARSHREERRVPGPGRLSPRTRRSVERRRRARFVVDFVGDDDVVDEALLAHEGVDGEAEVVALAVGARHWGLGPDVEPALLGDHRGDIADRHRWCRLDWRAVGPSEDDVVARAQLHGPAALV